MPNDNENDDGIAQAMQAGMQAALGPMAGLLAPGAVRDTAQAADLFLSAALKCAELSYANFHGGAVGVKLDQANIDKLQRIATACIDRAERLFTKSTYTSPEQADGKTEP